MKAGKTAIATALGCDIASIGRYQPTRTRGIYTDGTKYYACVMHGNQLPDAAEYAWKQVKGTEWFTRQYGLTIYEAE